MKKLNEFIPIFLKRDWVFMKLFFRYADSLESLINLGTLYKLISIKHWKDTQLHCFKKTWSFFIFFQNSPLFKQQRKKCFLLGFIASSYGLKIFMASSRLGSV